MGRIQGRRRLQPTSKNEGTAFLNADTPQRSILGANVRACDEVIPKAKPVPGFLAK